MVGIGRALAQCGRTLRWGLVVALVAAACGGSNTSSNSQGMSADQLAQVKALFQKESGPSQFAGGPAFDATKAKGKKVWWISNLGSNSFTPLIYNPFRVACDMGPAYNPECAARTAALG